jgi:hypothetical protein
VNYGCQRYDNNALCRVFATASASTNTIVFGWNGSVLATAFMASGAKDVLSQLEDGF